MHEIIETKTLVEKRILKLTDNKVILENGQTAYRYVLELKGASAILAFVDENTILLVKQYRYPIQDYLLELPAGMLEENEDPFDSAKRELLEETGYMADNIQYLTSFYTSPGIVKETIHLYVATNLHFVGQHLDEDEFINVIKMPVNEFEEKILNGQIKDGKTVLAYLYYKQNKK